MIHVYHSGSTPPHGAAEGQPGSVVTSLLQNYCMHKALCWLWFNLKYVFSRTSYFPKHFFTYVTSPFPSGDKTTAKLRCVPQLAQLLCWMHNCRTLSARFKTIYLHTEVSLSQQSVVWAGFVFTSQWCQLTHLVNRYRITDCNPQLVLLCLFGLWTEDWLLG